MIDDFINPGAQVEISVIPNGTAWNLPASVIGKVSDSAPTNVEPAYHTSMESGDTQGNKGYSFTSLQVAAVEYKVFAPLITLIIM